MTSELLLTILAIMIFVVFVISIMNCNSKGLCSGRETFDIKNDIIENYEERMGGKLDKDDTPDFYDKEFVEIYESVYRDESDSKNIIKTMKTKCLDNLKDKKLIKILIGGCGVNKTGSLLKKDYDNIICIDKSENMLLKAQQLHPECKYIHGDLRNPKLFEKGEFSHILLDERTLYYHSNEDMIKIIENCNKWLANQGFLIIPIYNPKRFVLGSRFYSTHYIDDKNNLHGFTYLNDFAHDCYYISKNEESGEEGELMKKNKNWYSYYDKIILDDGKKRIKKTDFYIPEPDELYTILLRRFFKVFYKDEFKDGTQIVGGYDTVIFRKEKNKMTVDEIEQKFNI
jgi:hypothetical protein